MKSFLEEYGFAILAAIVVVLLIAMATPIGNLVKTKLQSVIGSFGNQTEAQLNNALGTVNTTDMSGD